MHPRRAAGRNDGVAGLGVQRLQLPDNQAVRQVHLIEQHGVTQRAVRPPHVQSGRIPLLVQRRSPPGRQQVGRVARRRARAQSCTESLKQRFRQQFRLVAEVHQVATGELNASLEFCPPGHQCGRAAGHDGHAKDGGPPGSRTSDQEQCRKPEEGVPLGPAAAALPGEHPDHRGDHRPAGTEQRPDGASITRVLTQQPRGHHDHAGRGEQQGGLPRQPQRDRHPGGGGGDPLPQRPDQVGCRSQETESHDQRRHRSWPRGQPEPHPELDEQQSAHQERAQHRRDPERHLAKEQHRRHEAPEPDHLERRRAHHDPEQSAKEQVSHRRGTSQQHPRGDEQQGQQDGKPGARCHRALRGLTLARRTRPNTEQHPRAGRGRLLVIKDIPVVGGAIRRIDREPDFGPLPEALTQAAVGARNDGVGIEEDRRDDDAPVRQLAARLEDAQVAGEPRCQRVSLGDRLEVVLAGPGARGPSRPQHDDTGFQLPACHQGLELVEETVVWQRGLIRSAAGEGDDPIEFPAQVPLQPPGGRLDAPLAFLRPIGPERPDALLRHGERDTECQEDADHDPRPPPWPGKHDRPRSDQREDRRRGGPPDARRANPLRHGGQRRQHQDRPQAGRQGQLRLQHERNGRIAPAPGSAESSAAVSSQAECLGTRRGSRAAFGAPCHVLT